MNMQQKDGTSASLQCALLRTVYESLTILGYSIRQLISQLSLITSDAESLIFCGTPTLALKTCTPTPTPTPASGPKSDSDSAWERRSHCPLQSVGVIKSAVWTSFAETLNC